MAAPAGGCVAAFAGRRESPPPAARRASCAPPDDTDDSGCPPAAALACDRPLNTKVRECAWRRCDGNGDCTAGLRCRDGACRHDRAGRADRLADVSTRVGRRATQAAADAKAHCELLGREVLTRRRGARGA